MKKMLKSITLVLLAGMLVVMCGCGSKEDGFFDDLAWGTSFEDTRKGLADKEGAEPYDNPDGSKLMLNKENYLGVDGVNARIECSFADMKLKEVFVYLEFPEDANQEIMDRYAEILTEEYGKPSKDTEDTKIWKLKESEVHLANFSYGVLVIDYMPKN